MASPTAAGCSMRIAIHQGPGEPGDTDANLACMEAAAVRAADAGAHVLLFPEAFLSGYNIGAGALARAAQAADGPAAARLAAAARDAGVALLYGYAERDGGAVYNAAQLIDAHGERVASYRKSHLFGDLDREAFAAGDGAPVLADVGGWRAGILICYDVEFPENVRALALAGADLVLVPTALMAPYAFIPRAMVPTRAYENQVFLAYANRCGREGELVYVGESCVIGPDGAELARAGRGEELIVADLDRERLARSRAVNTYLADRRPEIYRALAQPAASAARAGQRR